MGRLLPGRPAVCSAGPPGRYPEDRGRSHSYAADSRDGSLMGQSPRPIVLPIAVIWHPAPGQAPVCKCGRLRCKGCS
jgi:hypothetical protein